MELETNWLTCEHCHSSQMEWQDHGMLLCHSCDTQQMRCLGDIWLQGEVCQGGGSMVYRGFDQVLERSVAVKIGGTYEDCLHEARLLAKFQVDSVVNVWGVRSLSCGMGYISMGWLDGTHLENYLTENGAFAEKEALALFETIWECVRGVHRKKILHCDIKPGNVMYDGAKKRMVLIDFGRSKEFGAEKHEDEAICVTPFYASPEALLGQHEDIRSDYYALGATFYQVLTGKMPIELNPEDSVEQILEKKRALEPVIQIVPKVSKAMSDLIMGLVAYEHSMRFANEEVVDAAFHRVKRATLSSPTTGKNRAKGGTKQGVFPKKRWIVTGVSALLALGVGVGLFRSKKTKAVTAPKVPEKILTSESEKPPERSDWKSIDRALSGKNLFAWQQAVTAMKEDGLEPLQREKLLISRVFVENFLGNTDSQKLAYDQAYRYFKSRGRVQLMAWLSGDVSGNQLFPGLSSLRDASQAWSSGNFVDAQTRLENLANAPFLGDEKWAQEIVLLLKPISEDANLLVKANLADVPEKENARELKTNLLKTTRLGLATNGIAAFKIDEALRNLEKPPADEDASHQKAPESDEIAKSAEKSETAASSQDSAEKPEAATEPSAEHETAPAPVISLAERAKEFEPMLKQGRLDAWLTEWSAFSPSQAQNEAYLGRKELISAIAAFFLDLRADLTGHPVTLAIHLKDDSVWERLAVDQKNRIWVAAQDRPNREIQWVDIVENDLIQLHRALLQRVSVKGPKAQSVEEILQRNIHAIAFDWLLGDKARAELAMKALGEQHVELTEQWRLWKLPLE